METGQGVAPVHTFHFTPTYASWLNAVEEFLSTITRRKIRRGVFKSVAELQDAIRRYIQAHNKAQTLRLDHVGSRHLRKAR